MEDKKDTKVSNPSRTKCEVWTRAMGYHRPVENFNVGKRSEFKERVFFCVKKTEKRVLEIA